VAQLIDFGGASTQFMTDMLTYAHGPEAVIGSIGTLKRRLAHGGASDWSSLRAWVIWVRV
jgi:hypothetical protein